MCPDSQGVRSRLPFVVGGPVPCALRRLADETVARTPIWSLGFEMSRGVQMIDPMAKATVYARAGPAKRIRRLSSQLRTAQARAFRTIINVYQDNARIMIWGGDWKRVPKYAMDSVNLHA